MNILKKYADRNYYDETFDKFLERLEAGRIGVAQLRSWDLYGSRCVTCDESVTAFRYRGERYDLVHAGGFWVIHQCPANKLYEIGPEEGQPEPEIDAQERADIELELSNARYPDDPEVRDGSGNIRSGGFYDDYPDDPYCYPDIPYVDPTR